MKFTLAGNNYDSEVPVLVGRDLKMMRIFAKVTTSVAAEYMGIKSRKTIENWESGQSSPSISQFLILCRYYDMNASKIIAQCIERAKKCNPAEEYCELDIAACSTLNS